MISVGAMNLGRNGMVMPSKMCPGFDRRSEGEFVAPYVVLAE